MEFKVTRFLILWSSVVFINSPTLSMNEENTLEFLLKSQSQLLEKLQNFQHSPSETKMKVQKPLQEYLKEATNPNLSLGTGHPSTKHIDNTHTHFNSGLNGDRHYHTHANSYTINPEEEFGADIVGMYNGSVLEYLQNNAGKEIFRFIWEENIGMEESWIHGFKTLLKPGGYIIGNNVSKPRYKFIGSNYHSLKIYEELLENDLTVKIINYDSMAFDKINKLGNKFSTFKDVLNFLNTESKNDNLPTKPIQWEKICNVSDLEEEITKEPLQKDKLRKTINYLENILSKNSLFIKGQYFLMETNEKLHSPINGYMDVYFGGNAMHKIENNVLYKRNVFFNDFDDNPTSITTERLKDFVRTRLFLEKLSLDVANYRSSIFIAKKRPLYTTITEAINAYKELSAENFPFKKFIDYINGENFDLESTKISLNNQEYEDALKLLAVKTSQNSFEEIFKVLNYIICPTFNDLGNSKNALIHQINLATRYLKQVVEKKDNILSFFDKHEYLQANKDILSDSSIEDIVKGAL